MSRSAGKEIIAGDEVDGVFPIEDNISMTVFLHLFLVYILNRNESCKAIHDEFLL
jgi:hypothetical protein